MSLVLKAIGFVIGFGTPFLFLYLAVRSLLSDLWKLALLIELPGRRMTGSVITALWAIVVFLISIAALGSKRGNAIFFVVFATVPALAWHTLRFWAWWRDHPDTREDALDVAIERSRRRNEPEPLPSQRLPWKDYVFDVEVARRRALYEPPPI